jgi:hypothetical protein
MREREQRDKGRDGGRNEKGGQESGGAGASSTLFCGSLRDLYSRRVGRVGRCRVTKNKADDNDEEREKGRENERASQRVSVCERESARWGRGGLHDEEDQDDEGDEDERREVGVDLCVAITVNC